MAGGLLPGEVPAPLLTRPGLSPADAYLSLLGLSPSTPSPSATPTPGGPGGSNVLDIPSVYKPPTMPPNNNVRDIPSVYKPPSALGAPEAMPGPGATLPPSRHDYQPDPDLLRALRGHESGDKTGAKGKAGEVGRYQVLPSTAAGYGVSPEALKRDPSLADQIGPRYYTDLLKRYHGNEFLALVAYNSGPGRVDRGQLVPRSVKYATAILKQRDAMRAAAGGGPSTVSGGGGPTVPGGTPPGAAPAGVPPDTALASAAAPGGMPSGGPLIRAENLPQNIARAPAPAAPATPPPTQMAAADTSAAPPMMPGMPPPPPRPSVPSDQQQQPPWYQRMAGSVAGGLEGTAYGAEGPSGQAPVAGGGTFPSTPYETPERRAPQWAVPNVDNMTPHEANFLGLAEHFESAGRNIPNYRFDPGHTAEGYWQITGTNWRRLAPRLGITAATPMSASRDDQARVALALLRESGPGNWTNYNPALRRAVEGGEQVRPPTEMAAAAPSGGEAPWYSRVGQAVGQAFTGTPAYGFDFSGFPRDAAPGGAAAPGSPAYIGGTSMGGEAAPGGPVPTSPPGPTGPVTGLPQYPQADVPTRTTTVRMGPSGMSISNVTRTTPPTAQQRQQMAAAFLGLQEVDAALKDWDTNIGPAIQRGEIPDQSISAFLLPFKASHSNVSENILHQGRGDPRVNEFYDRMGRIQADVAQGFGGRLGVGILNYLGNHLPKTSGNPITDDSLGRLHEKLVDLHNGLPIVINTYARLHTNAHLQGRDLQDDPTLGDAIANEVRPRWDSLTKGPPAGTLNRSDWQGPLKSGKWYSPGPPPLFVTMNPDGTWH